MRNRTTISVRRACWVGLSRSVLSTRSSLIPRQDLRGRLTELAATRRRFITGASTPCCAGTAWRLITSGCIASIARHASACAGGAVPPWDFNAVQSLRVRPASLGPVSKSSLAEYSSLRSSFRPTNITSVTP